MNPVGYFEIPVLDLERAVQFYTAVFGFDFSREIIDGNQMAHFPFTTNSSGISGSLAKGSIYKPSKEGTLIYFNVEDIEDILLKVNNQGGKTLYLKTQTGDYGFVAEFEDSEGNRIAIHSKNK